MASSNPYRFCLKAKESRRELTIARADVVLRASLRGASREQLNAKVAELKRVQSHLKVTKDNLITLYDEQTMITTEMLRFRTQNANKASKSAELRSPAKEWEQPDKRAKIVCGAENSTDAPSTAAYSALLAEHDGS